MENRNYGGKLMFNLIIVILLCMSLTITGCSKVDDSTSNSTNDSTSDSTSDFVEILDTPEIKAEMEKARNLAGDDESLIITQLLQSRDLDENGIPTGPPGVDSEGAKTYAEPTQIFDNLYYVGGLDSGSFIFTTSEGYIMIDAGYDYSPEEFIIPGMEKLGLDPAKIKYLLITHAGPDHVGGAKYFQENYGTHVIMSEQDWGTRSKPTGESKEGSTDNQKPVDGEISTDGEKAVDGKRSAPGSMNRPEKDMVGIDGQELTLGNTTITIVHTPRKVDGGGLSYIGTVFDNGEPHMWATYGNTNVVGTLEDKEVYRESVEHFLSFIDKAEVDSVISNHPFVDGSLELMEELRNQKEGEPNPFVFGTERSRNFFEILDQCAVVLTERQKAGLDETGTKKLEE